MKDFQCVFAHDNYAGKLLPLTSDSFPKGVVLTKAQSNPRLIQFGFLDSALLLLIWKVVSTPYYLKVYCRRSFACFSIALPSFVLKFVSNFMKRSKFSILSNASLLHGFCTAPGSDKFRVL